MPQDPVENCLARRREAVGEGNTGPRKEKRLSKLAAKPCFRPWPAAISRLRCRPWRFSVLAPKLLEEIEQRHKAFLVGNGP